MDNNNVIGKIEEYINEIPSLPVSVHKVLKICNNPASNPSDLHDVISLDPVLTGRLLKLINSAYYGFEFHAVSIVKAIIMLGLNTVKNLILSTAIMATLPKNKVINGINMEGFFLHCLGVGVISKLIASKQGINSCMLEEYFTAGLLHDIGKIPINAILSSSYLSVISAADHCHKSLFFIEDENLKINHSLTGSMITKSWKLCGTLHDVILYHHNPDDYSGENLNLVNIVALADYFSVVHEIGFAGNRNPKKPCKKIWSNTDINENYFEKIEKTVCEEIEKAKIFLNIVN